VDPRFRLIMNTPLSLPGLASARSHLKPASGGNLGERHSKASATESAVSIHQSGNAGPDGSTPRNDSRLDLAQPWKWTSSTLYTPLKD